MKKLMVLAVVATVAISSQAANWRWNMASNSLMYQYGSTTTSKTPFTSATAEAYIFAYTSTAQAEVFQQWYNNGAYGVTSLTGGLDTKKITDGQVAALDTNWEFQTGDTSGSPKFFFALIDDSGNLFISSTKSGSISQADGGTLLSFSAQSPSLTDRGALTAYSSAGWYKQASGGVPEPTSAMLMLLGVAGLALRRRRA